MNTNEKHFAIPKPAQKPYFPVMDNVSLNWLIGALAPPERCALGQPVAAKNKDFAISARADLERLERDQAFVKGVRT